QELCVHGGDTESDGSLAKPVATHLNTSSCLSHLFQAIENFLAISAARLGGPRHQ
ncbi:hypothetical protein ALC56_00240, partial [Trachymyrmex septentrionalis]